MSKALRCWVAGPVAAALALGGCSDGNGPAISAGPLGADIGPGSSLECVPAAAAGQYTVGLRVLSNPARQDAVLSSVQVLGADGLELVEAVVLPVQRMATGSQASWPPAAVEPQRWAQAVPLDGARVPAGSHLGTEVVAHVSATAGPPGSLTGFIVRYEVGGAPYAAQVPYGFEVREAC